MVRYATVPFRPEMREKDLQSAGAAKIVSEQMEEQITRMVSGGWIFHSYQTVEFNVNPGCLSIFAGGKTTVHTYGVLVFQRED